jgi:ribosomal-protein-alanine N-acetyltransferase
MQMSQKVDKIAIQMMSQEDVEEIARLEKICFSDPWSKESFIEELQIKLAIPLAVKLGEKVVGYACLWHLDDQLEIANIAVSPEHRKEGIGERVMMRIIEEAKDKNCRSIILTVRESNVAAINLYTKFGFVEIGRRKRYYRLPIEDALTMIKTL